jgi:hypothetical protein
VSKKQFKPRRNWLPIRKAVLIYRRENGQVINSQSPNFRAFGQAVANDYIALYARKGGDSEPFKRLLSTEWSRLKITDWQLGTAINDKGEEYFAIHGSLQSLFRRWIFRPKTSKPNARSITQLRKSYRGASTYI